MRITKITVKVSVAIIAASLLSACTPKMYYKASGNVDKLKTHIRSDMLKGLKQAQSNSSVIVKNSMYVSDKRIDLQKQPSWLQKPISLHGVQLPFSFYSRSIVRNSGVLTTYQQGLMQNKTVNLNYTGNVRGALNLLAAKTGYVYQVNGNHVFWKAFVTKTFSIAFMPGSSNYMVGKNNASSSGSSGSSGSSSSSSSSSTSSGSNSNAINGGNSGEYSNLKGKLSVWTDIKKTVSAMLSPQGKVIVSESTTTITVKDHPSNMKQIASYIKRINGILSEQVMLKVQVLQVNLSNSFQNGINWNMVTSFIGGTKFKFTGNFAQPVSISPLASALTSPQIGVTNSQGTSSVLFNALSQQGKVSVATEPTVVTTNDQVASINITSTYGYLAKIENTASDSQQSGGQTSTTLEPGKVTTGLTLYVLPKVMNSKIYLQISSDISSLVEIRNLFAKGTGTSTSSASSEKIQVPDIDSKAFNQRGVVHSGATLILAGFKQMHNQTNSKEMFQSAALGGRGASQEDVETVVLITPYILNTSNNE